jgi:plastocyanin
VALAALLGVAAAVVPTLASGQAAGSASFTAVDFAFNSSQGGNSASIDAGGTVSFSYPQGGSEHNVDFTGGPATPSCTQSKGTNSGSVPPVPHSPQGPGWAGSCTFSTPGTYTFHCDLHNFMTGTITVNSGGTTTTTTTTSPGTTTSTSTTTTPAPTSTGGPSPAAALGSVALASSQTGTSVRGSATVGHAGSTLSVNLLATRAGLARAAAATASAGRLTRHSVGPGRVSFSVALNQKARRALRRHGRLALTVGIRVTPPAGRAGTTTRHVTLHR